MVFPCCVKLGIKCTDLRYSDYDHVVLVLHVSNRVRIILLYQQRHVKRLKSRVTWNMNLFRTTELQLSNYKVVKIVVFGEKNTRKLKKLFCKCFIIQFDEYF